jgi:hypothetical protein
MKLVTFEDDQGAYDQRDAEGFIKLNALRLRHLAVAQHRPSRPSTFGAGDDGFGPGDPVAAGFPGRCRAGATASR